MTADGKGRLTVPLTLGTANPEQQYSPQAKAWMALADEAARWSVWTRTLPKSCPKRFSMKRITEVWSKVSEQT